LLLSMTGFGEAHCQGDGLAVSVEVRTINSRYLKVSMRVAEGYGALEPQIESILRGKVRRGTIQVAVRVDRARSPDDYRVNADVLKSYWEQLEAIGRELPTNEPVSLGSLLLLPGVVEEKALLSARAEEDWPVIRETLETAIEALERMRLEEGRAMAADLQVNCRLVAACLEQIERRAPAVLEAYRTRLEERLRKALADSQVVLEPADLLREVSLFGERSDISEEVVRLRSHLDQFQGVLDLPSPDGSGRRLEFLTQEMFREANTIGSKANDVQIAHQVIEIKAAVERIREMIQNIE